jgi:DNA polymerase epsilon subunit 1
VEHIKEIRPNIFVTYNGDTFDWMFLNERSKILRIPLSRSIGLRYDNANECYLIRWAPHLDCLRWVIRDSYLPQGSHGLKAVTKNKLRYNPLEVDPEKMLEYARERPQEMAAYSVSDAVATYYLYMQYVHPFIFSLCTILPLDPDDVLRKGAQLYSLFSQPSCSPCLCIE